MRRSVDERIWDQVEAVLGSGVELALATTGGGCELVSWLLNHPGASRAVVEVQVPYHAGVLRDYLGFSGPHRVEEKTALNMAGQAFVRARGFAGGEGRPVGLGCTAALATRRVRRGEERAYIALRLEEEYRNYELRFARGGADRLEQEDLLSRFALQALTDACGAGLSEEMELPIWVGVSERVLSLEDPLELVLRGEVDVAAVDAAGNVSAEVKRRNRLLLPGSFNPLHQGHVRLAEVAQEQSGREICLEISVENVDKPALSRRELDDRLEQLRGKYAVVVTRAPTFLEKARLFGDCSFVIGYDTVVRLLEGKYYEGGYEGMEEALKEMKEGGCRFQVAGRLYQGAYRTLDDLELPEPCKEMFVAIPEEVFRRDVSSTEIRRVKTS